MELERLLEFTIIFALAIAVLLICHRIRIPLIVGFLLTGILGGPHVLGLINSVDRVAALADLGIILLLFSIGMEFSIKNLMLYKRFFLMGGTLQVVLTSAAAAGILFLFSIPIKEALFLSWLISLSSTAIVLKILDQTKQSDTPQGKMILGVLIFQDLIAVPMMLLTPLLAVNSTQIDLAFFMTMGKGLLLLFIVFICAERIVPSFFYHITKTGSRELFLLAVISICFFVAWLAASVGLSLSLGAFLAGLILSESDYKNNALGDVLPFEGIFTSFFFISIGMLLDVGFFFNQIGMILPLAIAIVALKALTGSLASILIGLPLRTAVISGLALSQIGEFSFVLAKNGFNEDVIKNDHYQLFLALALTSMAFAPSLIQVGPWVADLFLQLPLPLRIKTGLFATPAVNQPRLEEHVIIIGFGICGKNLARACQEASMPYVVLEMNPETVLKEKRQGVPITFGDGTHPAVLTHANIQNAKSVAILINDTKACQRIAALARELNPKVYIIARLKYLLHMQDMIKAGANDVIVDEVGSSFEIFSKVMGVLNVSFAQIQKIVSDLQFEIYDTSRLSRASFLIEHELGLENFKIPEDHFLVGKMLFESKLKDLYGFSVIMIKRENQILSQLNGETLLQADDLLVLTGSKSTMAENLKNLTEYERYFTHDPA